MSINQEKIASLRIDRDAKPERRLPWVWIAVLLVAALAGTYWLVMQRDQAPIVKVATVREVGARLSTSVLNASGYVNARRIATVSSKFTGKVIEVLIEEGQHVTEGEVLARLDDVNLKRELALVEAQISAAKKNTAETHALIREAQMNWQRIVDLQAKGFATESERDTAQAQRESLEARLLAQQEQVVVAERQADVWRQQIEDTLIRAPFSGVIVSKDAQPGEMISPVSAGGGFTRTGIGTLVDMQSLEIEVDVNEAYINRIRAGQTVTANLDAYPDWAIPCKVLAIIPTADRQKATVEVRIAFDALDPRILPDMGVKVTFHDEVPITSTESAIYIPIEVVQFSGSENRVWVVENGKTALRQVALGNRDANGIRVLSGLNAGATVITHSDQSLEENQSIEVQP